MLEWLFYVKTFFTMASENKVVGDDVVEISTTKKIWPQNIGSHFITLLEEEVKKGNK